MSTCDFEVALIFFVLLYFLHFLVADTYPDVTRDNVVFDNSQPTAASSPKAIQQGGDI